jgi:hypothetical protein
VHANPSPITRQRRDQQELLSAKPANTSSTLSTRVSGRAVSTRSATASIRGLPIAEHDDRDHEQRDNDATVRAHIWTAFSARIGSGVRKITRQFFGRGAYHKATAANSPLNSDVALGVRRAARRSEVSNHARTTRMCPTGRNASKRSKNAAAPMRRAAIARQVGTYQTKVEQSGSGATNFARHVVIRPNVARERQRHLKLS